MASKSIFVLLDDQINRDPISNEVLKMRQQLEYLQAELCARGGISIDEIQVIQQFCVKEHALTTGNTKMKCLCFHPTTDVELSALINILKSFNGWAVSTLVL